MENGILMWICMLNVFNKYKLQYSEFAKRQYILTLTCFYAKYIYLYGE